MMPSPNHKDCFLIRVNFIVFIILCGGQEVRKGLAGWLVSVPVASGKSLGLEEPHPDGFLTHTDSSRREGRQPAPTLRWELSGAVDQH